MTGDDLRRALARCRRAARRFRAAEIERRDAIRAAFDAGATAEEVRVAFGWKSRQTGLNRAAEVFPEDDEAEGD